MRLHRVRVDRQHALPAGDGLGGLLALAVQLGQVLPEGRVVRRQLDGLFQPGQGVAELAFPLEGQADVGVGVRPGSGRAAGPPGRRPGPRRAGPSAPQGIAEVVVQGGPVGLQAHRLPAVRQGLLGLAAVEQQLAEVRAGRRRKGIQLDGAAEVLEGLVGAGGVRGARCRGCCGRRRSRAAVAGRRGTARRPRHGGPVACRARPRLQQGFGVVREQPQGRAAAAGRRLELAQGAVGLGQVGVEAGTFGRGRRPGRSARRPGRGRRADGAARRAGAGRRRFPGRRPAPV